MPRRASSSRIPRPSAHSAAAPPAPECIALDAQRTGPRARGLARAARERRRQRSTPGREWPFNIIYSSGTTGTPKGIVQSHGMRWSHVERGATYGYGPETVTLLATPLYSNTTLVVFFPTLAFGGSVVLMPKFDAAGYLALAERHRVTHTMLVPVQYQRIMALADFDAPRPVVLPLQVLHQRAVRRRAEGRRACGAGRAA